MAPTPDILYVDNHLLVLNKPCDLVTQPSGHHRDSLESRGKAWLKQEFSKSGNVFCEAVHRLDRPCSGIVLFARTGKALKRLNESIRANQMSKIYLAVLEGSVEEDGGVLEDYLVHGDHMAKVAKSGTAGAKVARLEYRVVQRGQGMSLVEIALETGRYHQIRVQFSHRGNPVAGDVRYGGRTGTQNPGIALHHHRLSFYHPVKREEMTIEAPMPDWGPWRSFRSEAPHSQA